MAKKTWRLSFTKKGTTHIHCSVVNTKFWNGGHFSGWNKLKGIVESFGGTWIKHWDKHDRGKCLHVSYIQILVVAFISHTDC